MGMGLMFCRSIIEVHGGRLWVTENVPQGTILRFTLPDNEDGASPTERGVQCARSNPSSLSSMTTPPCANRSEEHKYELQSLLRISYAVYYLKKNHNKTET